MSTCYRRGRRRLTAAVVIIAYFHVVLGRVGRCVCTGEYEFSGAVRSNQVDVVFLQDFSCTLERENELIR